MKLSFLIEGANALNFPEITKARELAEANSAMVFDPIESYSKKQLAILLEQLSPEQHPLVAVMILVDFSKESPLQIIWNKLVKPLFEDNPPAWLIDLTEAECNEFIQTQFQAHFGEAIDQYKLWAKRQHQIMQEISDHLSMTNFVRFLQENPEVDKIFALVGSAHNSFFSAHPETELVEEHGCCRQFTMLVNQRTISISLHHGSHGKLDHFFSMQQACREHGLVIPEYLRGNEADLPQLLSLLVIENIDNPLSSRHNTFFSRSRPEPPSSPQPARRQIEFNIEAASQRYDYWKKRYNHPADETPQQSLTSWLWKDSGAEHINNYQEFFQLAAKLVDRGYDLTTPPSEAEFNRSMKKFNQDNVRRSTLRW